ncbi:hypothetical protein AB0M45_33780, partial [Nocardia sp. NPDC051787]|uniref:hypothetical protein n=1 Tax=Nocardia sp. NPDC051787 TaxID=3155415 RepID=UPI00342A2A98
QPRALATLATRHAQWRNSVTAARGNYLIVDIEHRVLLHAVTHAHPPPEVSQSRHSDTSGKVTLA